jgi:hypothetical protein
MPAALNDFFEESGYPLPIKATGCPAAAAAAALIARYAHIVLMVKAVNMGFLSFFEMCNTHIGICH